MLDILKIGVEKYGNREMLRYRADDGREDISWKEFINDVNDLASFLFSEGVTRADIVSVYSVNRPEWAVSEKPSFNMTALFTIMLLFYS